VDADTAIPGDCQQRGSVLMLVLFMCLAAAVVIQTLSTVVLCAEHAVGDEAAGRARMAEKDRGLAALRERTLTTWEVTSWMAVGEKSHPVEGSLTAVADDVEWTMKATVRQEASVSRLMTSAWIERGRDGLDLPLAAMAAGSLTAGSDRELAWLEVEPTPCVGPESGELGRDAEAGECIEAAAYVCDPPVQPLLGPGCSVLGLGEPWRLDPGWCLLASEPAAYGVAPGPGAAVLTGNPGLTVRIPEDCGGLTAAEPALVIVTGGAGLRAENLGDFYGVIVVDDGSISLNGTTLHGAVFATEDVALGETGRVLFSRAILRWATDRSLARTRLVPGTRSEATE
jgi:hypothetical protein